MTSTLAETSGDKQFTLEESSDENVIVKKKHLDMLQQYTKYASELNPMRMKLVEAQKTIDKQNQDIVRLSTSLVELGRRNEELEKEMANISGIKELKIKLDSVELSRWTMEHIYKSRIIELTYNVDDKKITGFEYVT